MQSLSVLWCHMSWKRGMTLGAWSPRRGGRYSKFSRSSWATKGSRHWLLQRLCRFQLTWPQPFDIWSASTLQSEPCHEWQEPETLNENHSTATVQPYRCQSNVSMTKSLMSNLKYAAQVIVISTMNHNVSANCIWNWRNIHEMCGAVLLRSVCMLWENESHNTRRRRVGFAKWCYILNYAVWKLFIWVGNVVNYMIFMSCSFEQPSWQNYWYLSHVHI